MGIIVLIIRVIFFMSVADSTIHVWQPYNQIWQETFNPTVWFLGFLHYIFVRSGTR